MAIYTPLWRLVARELLFPPCIAGLPAPQISGPWQG